MNSMRFAKDRCPHKQDLAYRQGWTPNTTSPALSRGQLWHEILAIHYLAIQAGATTLARRQAISDHLVGAVEARGMEDCELVAWMYDGHEDMWGTDPDWEIIAVEDQRLCRLPNAAGRGSRFYIRMRIDLLVRERTVVVAGHRVNAVPGAAGPRAAKLWLVDHKSGQNLPTQKELDIDDQFGIYTWGCRQIGDPVFGSIYSAARTYQHVEERSLEERFSRTRLYRTDRELDTLAREAYLTARTAYAYKSGDAPRAPDTDRCRWRCPFTEPCLHGRKTSPEQEAIFLASGGWTRLTEDERLKERGYVDPQMPEGAK